MRTTKNKIEPISATMSGCLPRNIPFRNTYSVWNCVKFLTTLVLYINPSPHHIYLPRTTNSLNSYMRHNHKKLLPSLICQTDLSQIWHVHIFRNTEWCGISHFNRKPPPRSQMMMISLCGHPHRMRMFYYFYFKSTLKFYSIYCMCIWKIGWV